MTVVDMIKFTLPHFNLTRKIIPLHKVLDRHCSNYANASIRTKNTDKLGIFIFSSISLGAGCLGVWQYRRYYWKVQIIDETCKKFKESPVVAPSSLSQLDLFEFVKAKNGEQIKVEGEFQHDKEVLLGPRSAPAGLLGPVAQGMATNPQGYFVITPFYTKDRNIYFINRGWVPKALAPRDWYHPTGVVKLTVCCSSEEKANTFSPKNDFQSKKLIWLESSSLILASGLGEECKPAIILELIEDEEKPTSMTLVPAGKQQYPIARPPQPSQVHYVTPITHAVYSVTWFSLALAGLVMTYIKFRRGKKGPVRIVKTIDPMK